MRGVPGLIRARGEFPNAPLSHKTADIRFSVGAWWFSICVEMDSRRAHGAEDLRVDFNLIDEFARVSRVDRPCGAALEADFDAPLGESSQCHAGLARPSGADTADVGEAQEANPGDYARLTGADPADVGGVQVNSCLGVSVAPGTDPADVGGVQACFLRGDVDAIQSERDRRFKRGSKRWLREKMRAAKASAKKARVTREALHKWTSAIVARAARLEVVAPPVAETRSGRGTKDKPGAEVQAIAVLNRRIREQAPCSAVQMLAYKAAEAGILCEVTKSGGGGPDGPDGGPDGPDDDGGGPGGGGKQDHEIGVGGKLRSAAIAVRRARRVINKEKIK